MLVYHLLPEKFALGNLRLRRLKVARLDDMNDPFELLGATLQKKEHRGTRYAGLSRKWIASGARSASAVVGATP